MKRHKKLIIIIIILIAAIAVILFFTLRRKKSTNAHNVIDDYGSDSIVAGKTLYTGVIEPEQSYSINLDSDRTVESINVKAGDSVTAGQTLFTYQSKDYSLQVKQDQLEIQGYSDTIKSCQDQINELNKQKEAAQSDMKLQYDSQIQDLTSQLKQAQLDQQTKQAEIDSLNKKIASSSVTSPIDGIVSKVASSSSSDGSFITILSNTAFRIKATIDELNVGSLKEGMAVTISTRVNDKTYSGKITKIDTKTTAADNNVSQDSIDSDSGQTEKASNYNFYVSIDNPDGLIVGQHVFVEANETDDGSAEESK